MKRPLLTFTLSFILGIMTANISNSYLFVAAAIIFLISILLSFSRKLPGLPYIFAGIILFYSAGALEYLYLNSLYSGRFKEFTGEQVTLKGYIASEPEIKDYRVSYIIKVIEIESGAKVKKISGKVLLNTLNSEGTSFYEYGREVEIWGKLDSPGRVCNPGGFDYRMYLAQKGVSSTIFARSENIRIKGGRNTNVLVNTGLAIRKRIVIVIEKSLPEQQAGLLNGMLIGYREGLTESVEEAFSDAGLSHLMAVSGANVAFIVFPLVFLFKKFRLRRNTSNPVIIGILALFVFVTGLEPSVVRAVIMAVAILAGQLIRREADVYTSMSFAALIMLLANPYTLFNIGFQLSFAATFSLVLFYNNIKKLIKVKYLPEFIKDVLAGTLAAQAGVLPVTAVYFNKVSLISVLSNLFAVPVVEAITILGSIMAVLGQISVQLSKIVGYVNCTLLSFVLLTSKLAASVPFASVQIATPSIWLVLVYYFTILFFFWYKPKFHPIISRRQYAAALCVVLVLAAGIFIFTPKELEVTFIDIGEGDSAVIRSYTGKTVLIDGGGHSSGMKSDTNIGDTVVIPFLLDFGVTKLDMVVATHGHADHIEGLIPVLKDFHVDNLVIPQGRDEDFKELIGIAGKRDIQVRRCVEGNRVKLDDKTVFDVLYPAGGTMINNLSLNNSSLVLKLLYRDLSILFTGDIEAEAEQVLLERKTDVEADVLKVAHHGSETSTTGDFLSSVNPKAAVISVGKNNFGHPSSAVLERLSSDGVRLFITERDGAVILKSDGRNIRFIKTIDH